MTRRSTPGWLLPSLLLALGLVTGCATTTQTSSSTVTVTASATSTTTNLSPDEFKARMATDITNAGNAYNALSTAFATEDLNTAHAACTHLGDTGRDLGAILPSPQPKLTAALQQVVDEIATVEGDCLALGPSSTNADFQQVQSAMSRLNHDLQHPGGH